MLSNPALKSHIRTLTVNFPQSGSSRNGRHLGYNSAEYAKRTSSADSATRQVMCDDLKAFAARVPAAGGSTGQSSPPQ